MLLPRALSILLFSWVTAGWSQIELPEDLLPDEEERVEEPGDTVEPVDEEAIRSMTRHIQSRVQFQEVSEPMQDHPALRHFEKVVSRLEAAPERVRIRIDFQNGSRKSGSIPNGILDIQTAAGVLPVLWSEIQQVDAGKTFSEVELRGGDGFRAKPFTGEILLEREDASTEVILLRDVQAVTVSWL